MGEYIRPLEKMLSSTCLNGKHVLLVTETASVVSRSPPLLLHLLSVLPLLSCAISSPVLPSLVSNCYFRSRVLPLLCTALAGRSSPRPCSAPPHPVSHPVLRFDLHPTTPCLLHACVRVVCDLHPTTPCLLHACVRVVCDARCVTSAPSAPIGVGIASGRLRCAYPSPLPPRAPKKTPPFPPHTLLRSHLHSIGSISISTRGTRVIRETPTGNRKGRRW